MAATTTISSFFLSPPIPKPNSKPQPKPRRPSPLISTSSPSFPTPKTLTLNPTPFLWHFHKHLPLATPRSHCSSQTPPFPTLPSLSTLTPLRIVTFSLLLSLSLFAAKSFFNPLLFSHLSIAFVFYPWLLVSLLTVSAAFFCLRGRAAPLTVPQQLVVVAAAVAWLTAVPAAHFNGFLEGWPVAFFAVYHYFAFFEASVRKRLYGDLLPRAHDPKWDVALPGAYRAGYVVSVLAGHWLAAYEAPELHLVPGGWANAGISVLVMVALFMRYHAVLYLAKYSEKVAVPTTVVQFGPYRWVRHPIYASVMLLFAAYCTAMRAPLSGLFLVAVSAVYYGRKAAAEEELMEESFGERYTEYKDRVRYKLIPLVY